MIEKMLADYSSAYGLNYVALRYLMQPAQPCRQYRGRPRPETHLIPLILQAAQGKRDSVSIFGTDYPHPRRHLPEIIFTSRIWLLPMCWP